MNFSTFYAPCHRCSSKFVGPIDGFLHDVKCWGWRTAIYNLRLRFWDPDGLLDD